MTGSYDIDVVILSIVVAMMASYVALDLAGRVTRSEGRAARLWLLGGAFAMGAGIWSMHFIGMLAFRLPIRMAYDLYLTFFSLLIAIVVSGFALHAVSRPSLGAGRLLAGGLLMGSGITAMHYTGMAAMRMFPSIRYDPVLLAASVLIAVGASLAALYLAFTLRAGAGGKAFLYRALSAVVMGLAISGMHYTGMAAAHYAPGSVCRVTHAFDLDNEALAYVIGFAIMSLLAVTLIGSVFDNWMSGQRARMLRDLQARNRELRFINDIIAQTTQPFCAVDLQGRMIRSNPALQALNGYSAEELRIMPLSQLSSGRWPERDLQMIAQAVSSGQPVRYENEYRHKDGRVFMAEVVGGAYRGEDGQIECAYAFVSDLTERRQAEARLRESEQRFRGVFEAAAIGMALVSLEGRWLQVNGAVCRMTGYGEAELLATDFQSVTHPDDLQADLTRVQRLRNGEIPNYQMEKRYIRKDRSTVWVLLSVSLMRAADGSPAYFVSLIEDISERKQAEAALAQRTRELERSNLELEQYAFAAAHDLQTPLRGIAGYARLLQRDTASQLNPQATELLQGIVNGCRRMQRLVESMLEYGRISNNPARHWVSLGEVLAEAQATLAPEIHQRDPVFEVGSLPTVYVDAALMRLLLHNLLDNAIRYQPRDPPLAGIGARHEDGAWTVSVADRGIGIEPQHHQRIFQMFQRLHPEDKYEGSGIGLAQCEKIVRAHGGRIWLTSKAGEGSVFHFSIPDHAGND